jgi:DNA (cytosine-5)-methyltransferase 1
MHTPLTSLEICAGTGGQALGLAMAGFHHVALVEIDADACETLRRNRPEWNVVEEDVRFFDGSPFRGIDLLAGGVPCPPFSIAGRQLGSDDDRDLFPAALALVKQTRPRAIILENVPGLLSPRFAQYRTRIRRTLKALGYLEPEWAVANASDFGVPQLRPRSILVTFRDDFQGVFRWPEGRVQPSTVGETLRAKMSAGGWKGADKWSNLAKGIAPTIVGGSKKHGGPDLGPTRAKKAWRALHVDANGIADMPPSESFPSLGMPKLTVRMAAALQGFPDEWFFVGRKTSSYRQVGNAFPPPVATAFGTAIVAALSGTEQPSTEPMSRLLRVSA